MLVAGWDEAFEFLEPVLYDIESSWVRRVSTLDDVKIASVTGNVVGNAGYVDILVADAINFDSQSKDKLVRIQSRVDALAFRAIHFDGLGCLAFDRNGYPRTQEQTCT